MTPYEYKILAGTTPAEVEKQLNQLAAEGWEVASTACGSGGSMLLGSGSIGPLIVLVLRRPRSGGE
jgi:hypothetical protein